MRAFAYFVSRLKPFILLFLFLETVWRGVLLVMEHQNIDPHLGVMIKTVLVGLLFDISVVVYFLIPIGLYLLLLPTRAHGGRKDRIIMAALYAVYAYILLFTSTSEWFFWDEFTSRFNFIAVDYLVYTHEVIGNIMESYPVIPLLAAIGLVSFGLAYRQYRQPIAVRRAPAFGARFLAFSAMILLAVLSFVTANRDRAEVSDNRYLNQIARNGIFEIFSAFRHNELAYDQFYPTEDEEQLLTHLRQQLDANADWKDDGITRHITATAPETPRNVVLITVESLSASYMQHFGNDKDLTPNLDQLAKESLFFSNLYATGTRTVYGLSAITLSIPPLPGNSIVRRQENDGLFSLGSVLNRKGYDSKFVYGGYGYFDNMNQFFSGNGYKIVDRADLAPEEITFANVWGVCDEDLFQRVLKESDASYAAQKPFFQMVMTTSNHRPFTYPDGKIDLPSKSGRFGGVKYTDYAIGKFLAEAKKRPWFDNTIFVIVADHTAGSAGKGELNPASYHIPLFIYAPGFIPAREVTTLASQIDLAPTLLGLMNMEYDSRFYGQDILRGGAERAFISNYQQLGYLTPDALMIMKPIKKESFLHKEGDEFVAMEPDADLRTTALSYFQTAARWKRLSKDIK